MIGMTFRMKFVLHSRDKINWLSLITHSGVRGFWCEIRYACDTHPWPLHNLKFSIQSKVHFQFTCKEILYGDAMNSFRNESYSGII